MNEEKNKEIQNTKKKYIKENTKNKPYITETSSIVQKHTNKSYSIRQCYETPKTDRRLNENQYSATNEGSDQCISLDHTISCHMEAVCE